MKKTLFIGLSIVSLTGCLSTNSYTSVEYQKYKQSDLKIPEKPYAVDIETEFQRNGIDLPKVNKTLNNSVQSVLYETKITTHTENSNKKFKFSANNIANIGSSAAKGALTGLTFGLAGSTVEDNYKITCTYYENGKELNKAEFDNLIISTVGLKSVPAGLIHHDSVNDAFNNVIKDSVINCLGDLQKKGYLVK